MEAQDDITWKQLIWYGHVERMDSMRLTNIMITWKPEGRKKMRSSLKNLERWAIYSHEWKRPQIGRMKHSEAMEYGSRKASPDVLKPLYIYILRGFKIRIKYLLNRTILPDVTHALCSSKFLRARWKKARLLASHHLQIRKEQHSKTDLFVTSLAWKVPRSKGYNVFVDLFCLHSRYGCAEVTPAKRSALDR
jgi:dsRNA-specific ribonuclease